MDKDFKKFGFAVDMRGVPVLNAADALERYGTDKLAGENTASQNFLHRLVHILEEAMAHLYYIDFLGHAHTAEDIVNVCDFFSQVVDHFYHNTELDLSPGDRQYHICQQLSNLLAVIKGDQIRLHDDYRYQVVNHLEQLVACEI